MSLDYTQIDREFHLYPREFDVDNKSFIYGEVDYEPIYNILKNDIHFHEGDSFLDIGSGCGKLVIGLSLFPIFKSMFFHGIEIHEKRYNRSIQLQDSYDCHDTTEFTFADFNTIYFGNYQVIYCCNTIFGEKENNKLFTKILNEFIGYFILFEYDNILSPYLIKSIKVNTSWNKKVEIFIFRK